MVQPLHCLHKNLNQQSVIQNIEHILNSISSIQGQLTDCDGGEETRTSIRSTSTGSCRELCECFCLEFDKWFFFWVMKLGIGFPLSLARFFTYLLYFNFIHSVQCFHGKDFYKKLFIDVIHTLSNFFFHQGEDWYEQGSWFSLPFVPMRSAVWHYLRCFSVSFLEKTQSLTFNWNTEPALLRNLSACSASSHYTSHWSVKSSFHNYPPCLSLHSKDSSPSITSCSCLPLSSLASL